MFFKIYFINKFRYIDMFNDVVWFFIFLFKRIIFNGFYFVVFDIFF